jgi:hypothetical protein
LQNLHPVGGQPDTNLIRLVASRIQTIDKFRYFLLDSNLHPAGGRLNEICIQLIEICIWLIEICIWLDEICIRLAAN